MPSPELPKEVWERVIGWIPFYNEPGWSHHSKVSRETLCSCSLVCRSWLHRCQLHLFYIVELSNSQQALTFLTVIGSSTSIGRSVSDLVIGPPNADSEEALKTPCYNNWIYTVLTTLPPILTKLRRLEFRNLPTLHPMFIGLASRFQTIHGLGLTNLINQSFREIIRLVNRFSHLHDLDLSNCQWVHPAHCYTGKQFELRKLQVGTHDTCSADVPKWLISSHSASALITLSNLGFIGMSELRSILEECTSTLRRLVCGIDDPQGMHILPHT